MAKTTSIATFTSATWSRSGSRRRPKGVVSAPKGTTANAAKAAVAEMIGAIANRRGSAARGRNSSLNISLTTSASGCSRPRGPTRYGPTRCCRNAASLRSKYTMSAAELSSITKTNSVRPSWASSSGVTIPLRRPATRPPARRAGPAGRPGDRTRDQTPRRVPPESMGLDQRPGAPLGRQRAAALADVGLVFLPEVLQRCQHRRGGGVAEGAQRLAGDVAGDAAEQIEVAHRPLPALDPAKDLVEPVGALAAGRALPARLVAVEVQQVLGQPDHAGRLVHDDDGRRPEERARLLHPVEARRNVQLLGQQDRHRRAAGNDRLQRVPLPHAAGVVLDERPERHVHRRLVDAGPPDVAADAVQLGPAVLLRPERRVPLGPIGDDERDVAQRLDVVDGGRLVVEADERGKRRLVARLGALALERLEQRRLLARLVGARAAVDVDVARKTRPEEIPAQEPARVGLLDRALEHLLHVEELAADVDVGHPRADRIAGDRAPLDE